ncbi:MAG: hypothetical protein KGJ06_03780 [Pseudomonadota bacterium]|nr:hypothetical protein [Pseudomonadota bacterium]
MEKAEPKKSPWRKIENRNRRLIFKATATDGNPAILAALVGEEYKRRTTADRHDAYHTLLYAMRAGRDTSFSDPLPVTQEMPEEENFFEVDHSSHTR